MNAHNEQQGFTAGDMADQQPADVDGAMKNLRDAILRNDGLTRKNTLAAFRAVEDALSQHPAPSASVGVEGDAA